MVASKELTDDVRLAHVMADDADSISMSRFRAQDLRIKTKPDSTPVTEADTAVEESIRRTLSRTRPRDAVHGEAIADTCRILCFIYIAFRSKEHGELL